MQLKVEGRFIDCYTNNLKIKKIRDKDNDLIIRTIIEGEFNISGFEFDFFTNGTNYYKQHEAYLYVEICDAMYMINGFVELNSEFDFYKKIATLKFFVKDKYFNLLDNDKYSEKINIAPANSECWLIDTNMLSECTSMFNYKLTDVIKFLANKIQPNINVVCADSVLQNIYLTQAVLNIDFYTENNEREIMLSFKDLMTSLRNQFYIQWYIDNDMNINLLWRKSVNMQTTDDLSEFETLNSRVLKFDKSKKYSIFELQTFDIETDSVKKYFASGEVFYKNMPSGKMTVKGELNACPYIFDNQLISIFNYQESQNKSLRSVNNYLYDVNNSFQKFSGDMNRLDFEFKSEIAAPLGIIRTSNFFFYKNTFVLGVSNSDGKISFTFNFTNVPPEQYATGDLVLTFSGDPTKEYQVRLGYNHFPEIGNSNVIFQSPDKKWAYFQFQFKKKIAGAKYSISNFAVNLFDNNTKIIKKSKVNEINIDNMALSNYTILQQRLANQPTAAPSETRMKFVNKFESYGKNNTCLQKNINVKRNIFELNFFNKVKTLDGDFQIDEAIKDVVNQTDTELTLSKYI